MTSEINLYNQRMNYYLQKMRLIEKMRVKKKELQEKEKEGGLQMNNQLNAHKNSTNSTNSTNLQLLHVNPILFYKSSDKCKSPWSLVEFLHKK